MRAKDLVQEIQRIPSSEYVGGRDYMPFGNPGKMVKRLPGKSGFLYSYTPGGGPIKIWDPKGVKREDSPYIDKLGRLVGMLQLYRHEFPIPNAVEVGTINVDEDYRNMGIAKALYGIVLTILKCPLIAGDMQTPGGRKNWVSLSKIPGVEIKGYVSFPPGELTDDRIDIIMGQLGGDYIGKSTYGYEYFAFNVLPVGSEKELKAAVNTKLSQLYGEHHDINTGLYAIWTGR